MKKTALALAFAGASLASTGAMAQVYVLGGVGSGNIDVDCAGAAQCDKSDTAYKFVGGYSFGNGFSAELGYTNYGKAKASDSGIRAELEANALQIGAAYQAPLATDWGLNLRLGLARMKTEISGSIAGVGSGSDSDTTTQPYFGIGVNYAFSKQVKVELGADFSKAEFDGDKGNVRAVTVGLRYDF
ncbi:porin family protein [Caldimonas sp. KR1-144]